MFRRSGVGVMLWTVSDPTLIARHLADTRIDVLITDRPRFASTIRSEMAVVQSANNHRDEIEVQQP